MRATYITLIILSSISLVLGCKKGKNDPILSLQTRKARMTEEWKIDSWTKNIKHTGTQQNGSPINDELTFDLTQDSYEASIPWGYFSEYPFGGKAIVEKAIWNIDKKGNWERILEYTSSSSFSTKQIIETKKGVWNFLSKSSDYKNKERVVFNVLSSYQKVETTTPNGVVNIEEKFQEHNNGEVSEIFEIDQLKSKEIVLKRTNNKEFVTPIEHRIKKESEIYILKK